MIYLFIAFGGAAGSVLRYVLGRAIQGTSASGFPIGTMVVNISGCFLIGILLRQFLNMQVTAELRALLVVGFCGGFTTLSTFSGGRVGGVEGGGEAGGANQFVFRGGPLPGGAVCRVAGG